MAKFKSGDRVVYLDNSYLFSCGYVQHGQTYTVGCMLSEHLVQLKEFGDFTFGKGSFRVALSSEAPTTTPHKHAAVIKAWADGAEIEYNSYSGWESCSMAPRWDTHTEYRVKPEKKPDVMTVARVQHINGQTEWRNYFDTEVGGKVQFTFDGETGKLKAVELLA